MKDRRRRGRGEVGQTRDRYMTSHGSARQTCTVRTTSQQRRQKEMVHRRDKAACLQQDADGTHGGVGQQTGDTVSAMEP